MIRVGSHPCVALLLCAVVARAATIADLRQAVDTKPLVRASLGVRSARALSPTKVEVNIGLSCTDIAGSPEAWRVVSEGDAAYAFARFVRPKAADLRRESETPGVAGSAWREYRRTVATLTLPSPMQPGRDYQFIGQGVGAQLLTGARSAAGLVFGQESPPHDPRVDLAVLGLRHVASLGPGWLELQLGPNFSPEAGSRPDNYQVTVAGQRARVVAVGRRTMVDAYLPVGWPFEAIVEHRVCLRLDRPTRPGDLVEVRPAPSVTTPVDLGPQPLPLVSPAIKANQVGYLTRSPVKLAYLGRWLGAYAEAKAAPAGPTTPAGPRPTGLLEQFVAALATAGLPTASSAAPVPEAAPAAAEPNPDDHGPALWLSPDPTFTVCEAATGRVAWRGTAKLVHRSGELTEGYYRHDHSGENVWTLDFTALQQPGRYYLDVPGVGRSLTFTIGDEAYRRAFEVQAHGVFLQRCGCELGPPWSTWRRIACHRAGVTPTTQQRLERHDIKELPKKVDYTRAADAQVGPEMAVLDRDPALLARWALDGDWRDASGHGHDLTPRRAGQPFTPDRAIYPGRNQGFGPTGGEAPLGAQVALPLEASAGATLAFWLKHDGRINFNGTICGYSGPPGKPRLVVSASWGVLYVIVGQGVELPLGRVADGKWHHVAVTVSPERSVVAYLDGKPAGKGEAKAPVGGDTFLLGALEGKELDGKYFDDARLYCRALGADEVATLAKRWGEQALALPVFGGHHDAGDYNPRSHLDVAQNLMDAYEMAPAAFTDGQLRLPESGNGLPDILDEADWALRLWRGLQDEDGGVYGGTESNGDPNFLQTAELDILGDYAYAKDAAASLEFAGAMAQAARIRRVLGRGAEADDLLTRARRAYNWASTHEPQAGSPRSYAESWLCPRAYAAVELLRTTGEPTFGRDYLATSVWTYRPDADVEIYQLYDQQRAAYGYALLPPAQAEAKAQAAARSALLRWADWMIGVSATMAYGFVRHPQAPITWGSGATEHYAIPVLRAWHLTRDSKYLTWLVRTCDNTLGANPLGVSYITGLGERCVRAPLHNSRYGPSGEVAPGQQVEGPNARGEGYRVQEVAFPKLRGEFASLYTFADCHFAIAMDEGLVRAQAESMAVFGVLAGL